MTYKKNLYLPYVDIENWYGIIVEISEKIKYNIIER